MKSFRWIVLAALRILVADAATRHFTHCRFVPYSDIEKFEAALMEYAEKEGL